MKFAYILLYKLLTTRKKGLETAQIQRSRYLAFSIGGGVMYVLDKFG